MLPDKFSCFLVTRDAEGNVTAEFTEVTPDDLPEGEAIVRVAYSSLNYKDALAATGHPGVHRAKQLVPGVDLAGTVVDSGVYEMVDGDPVIATGFDLGSVHWGGWAEYARVPHAWTVPLPDGLSLRESMILGTAGFTAGLCIDALQRHGIEPDSGEVVVTGASGGVGSMAVAILGKLGYEVLAVSGKTSAHDYLRKLGAREILSREDVDDRSGRPMLKGRFAGIVDTVGGNILTTLLRSMKLNGCATACGLTAGHDLSMTVYPFILRAVTLVGIDAAWSPSPALRHEIWQRLAGSWKPDDLDSMADTTRLDGVVDRVDEILAGKVTGRVLIDFGTEE